MDINKWLEFIDRFKDIAVVRFFSRFYSESFLSPYIKAVQSSVSEAGSLRTARNLALIAIGLILFVFIVDQALYYTQQETRDQVKNTFGRGVEMIFHPGKKKSGK